MNTTIYALTDSHQESRNLSWLLSGIYNFEISNNKEFLVLDAGDIFKGIYSKDLSVESYITLKNLIPKAQIFITLGNNDFGFCKQDFEYLKDTLDKFRKNDINVVCANIREINSGKSPSWIDRYKIVNINNTKYLIIGFCLNNSCAKKFGLELLGAKECFDSVIEEVKGLYDKVIVLNHHWYKNSLELFESLSVKPDLVIGGHEHSPIEPDYKNNIYYPLSFARKMYKIEFNSKVEKVEYYSLEELEFVKELETPILEYEQRTQLKVPIVKRVFDLSKSYSNFCPMGTFISDCMQQAGQTDIAFHSTGFTMYPLLLKDSDVITLYDLDKVICAKTPIVKLNLTVGELKKVFEHTTTNRMIKEIGNARFVQCSQNVTITGKGDTSDLSYKIIQININGVDLLDNNANPKDNEKVISCTIDNYIGVGEQGFDMLKLKPKTPILDGDENIVLLKELFNNSIIEAGHKQVQKSDYPSAKWIEL